MKPTRIAFLFVISLACGEGTENPEALCESDFQCGSGMRCVSGTCKSDPREDAGANALRTDAFGDAAAPDATIPDATVFDAKVPDAEVSDAAPVTDAMVPDAAVLDAGVLDARLDARQIDAWLCGPTCGGYRTCQAGLCVPCAELGQPCCEPVPGIILECSFPGTCQGGICR